LFSPKFDTLKVNFVEFYEEEPIAIPSNVEVFELPTKKF